MRAQDSGCSSTEYDPVRLTLHYVSLNDWKPEYAPFRDQNPSKVSWELSEAWSDRTDFTLDTPRHEIHDIATRFTWGDYVCLSYAWEDSEKEQATIFLDGVAKVVSKRLEAVLEDIRSSYECKIGMKVWLYALCVDQASILDRNTHILRIKDVFGGAFAVHAWTKEGRDLEVLGLQLSGDNLFLCEAIFREYGKQVLEELLGVRHRKWGEAEDEDHQLHGLTEGVDVLVFDQYYWADSDDSDDSDELGFGELHLRDSVCTELWMIFHREYWSRLWVIQELAVSPTTSTVMWGDSTVHLSTLQAHDKVYGILGLFPSSVSSMVTIDYGSNPEVALAELA
ncbi:hypothetical protein PG989_005664 [Apiospora arundinis]